MRKVSSWREEKFSGRKEKNGDVRWGRGRGTKRTKRRRTKIPKNFKLLKQNFTIDTVRGMNRINFTTF